MSRVTMLAACAACLGVLIGCGVTPAVPSREPATPASINGNWLLTGAFPSFLPVAGFGMSATLDVVNGQVVPDLDTSFPCGNGGFGGAGEAAVDAISADGSFTLQSPSPNGFASRLNYTIQGKVPQTASQSWSGTFTVTDSTGVCSPISGTFTAAPIAPVTGTFTGNPAIAAAHSNVAASLTATLSLQQGGPASLDATQSIVSVNSVKALSGSIHTTGSNCFGDGTVSGYGDVLGSFVAVTFKMDDGSALSVTGDIQNTATSSIVLRNMVVHGGNCDGWSGGFQTVLKHQ